MKWLIATLVAAFFMSASPTLANHVSVCAPRDTWVKNLKERYGERLVEFGLTNDGGLLERFATPNGSTWTLLITSPSGNSCGIAAGEGWEKAVPKLLKPTGQPI